MSESVVRSKFPFITGAFLNWRSARQIVRRVEHCKSAAFVYFRHSAKLNAIAAAAQIIYERGFEALRLEIQHDPVSTLRQFPYIGPVTCLHLAKNLGLPAAKADRHVSRIAQFFGYEDVQEFCQTISSFTGDPIGVVDIVLWRFAKIVGSGRSGFKAAWHLASDGS